MKTKKRLSILLVCVAAVFCLGCAFAFTACGNGDEEGLTEVADDDGVLIEIPGYEDELFYEKAGVIYEIRESSIFEGYECWVYWASEDITEANIPSEFRGVPVVTIGGGRAFQDCKSLKSVTIPDSVTSIGSNAFRGCTSLTSITIPDSVTGMGSCAFGECTSLKTATLGNGLDYITTSLFYGCYSLESVTFSSSVQAIDESAFSGCTSLSDVYFDGTQEEWESINIHMQSDGCLENATVHFLSEDYVD